MAADQIWFCDLVHGDKPGSFGNVNNFPPAVFARAVHFVAKQTKGMDVLIHKLSCVSVRWVLHLWRWTLRSLVCNKLWEPHLGSSAWTFPSAT